MSSEGDLDAWLGLTAGYRLTFDDPLRHQALFGTLVVMAPLAVKE